MPFHVQKSDPGLTDRIGSVVALVLLIASWSVVYVKINPADPAPRAHVAAPVFGVTPDRQRFATRISGSVST